MARLVALFEDAGCCSIRTYIQSGNVVFTAKPAIVRRLPKTIVESISKNCGLDVPVVIRTAEELRRTVRSNPFLEPDADEKALHVAFLADRPDARSVARLDPNRSPPDEFAVVGRELFLRLPNGVARSKLTNAYFDSRLGTTSTVRNWRTTLKLLDLATG